MHCHSNVEERDLGPPMTPPTLSTLLATQLFSRFKVPGSRRDDGLQRPKHVVLQLRFTHISCNKLVCNSCLVRNLNSYIYLLCSTFSPSYFNTIISTTGMIHLITTVCCLYRNSLLIINLLFRKHVVENLIGIN